MPCEPPVRGPAPLPCLRTPVSSRTAASGSAVRATDVPTNTRSAPAAARRSTSARVSMPLSATAGTPAGTRASRRSASPRSTANVPKSRLFTPTAAGSTASARSSSASEWTSASTPTAGPASAGAKRRGSGDCAARRSSSRARARRSAMRSRVALRMASRRLSGMLAFGRFSGRLGFGFRSGETVPLTRRQREILDFISGQIAAQGYAPSFEEIAQRFTFRSLATVHEHLTNLERKGYIRRAHNESRGIEVVPPRGQTGASELPLYGLVAAGEPIEAVSGSDTIAVPDELVPRRGRSYVLKVRGQSMIDEHIKDGDFIVVHERNQADNGQTVVALVQGSSATVKRFYREAVALGIELPHRDVTRLHLPHVADAARRDLVHADAAVHDQCVVGAQARQRGGDEGCPVRLGHAHHLAPYPGGVGERAQQVHDGPDGELAPHRTGVFHGGVEVGREQECDARLS